MRTTIAERIRALRERNSMTQDELAEASGVNRVTIAKYELGKIAPSSGTLARLAAALRVTTDYIVGLDQGASSDAQEDANVIRIPVLGTIQAGIPIEAIEEVLDWEEAPADWVRGGAEYFALEIHGDSMNPAYLDGDVVIFRKQPNCDSGDDCAIMINGDDATFKRVKINPRGLMLQALNPDYDSYQYTSEEVETIPVRILGVAVELRRKFKKL